MENFTPLMTIKKKPKHTVAITDSVMKKPQCLVMAKSKRKAEIIKKNKQNITVPVIKYHSAPVQPDRLWPISTKKILRGKNNPH